MTFQRVLGESAEMTKACITAIVLSAGKGSRMHSSLPKSLHPVAGQPILARILAVLKKSHIDEVHVVINREQDHLIRPVASAFKAQVFFQEQKVGTAAGVLSAGVENLKGDVLIINGDHPLISASDLANMINTFHKESADLCVGSCMRKDPGDYGRIIRQKESIIAIAEKETLTYESRKINEVNTGIYMVKAQCLLESLSQINCENPKKEYCLTDMVSIAVNEGKKVITCTVSGDSAFGVNTQKELAFVTKKIFIRKLNHLMSQGVIIVDPLNTYIEESVQIGQGSIVYPGSYLRGQTTIGPFCAIESNSFIINSLIHELVLIRSGSYLESAEVGAQSVIGPYARLRPGTKIGEECRVGNFVEMKKTHFGSRSKASHLSYLGDADIGEDVNIGCGTVTCNLNMDGKKYKTHIGDKVFIGSGTQMVAPVKIEDCSGTGAGSVITEDIPSQSLGLSRVSQKNLENYFRRKTKEKTEDK